ncbi:MAG: oligosaccharide flippase family protein, partial [Elusimicrobiota bacterium]
LLGAKASRHMHHIPRGLRLISPLVLPPTHSLFRLANRYWFLPRLVRDLRRRRLRDNPLVFSYVPSETTIDLIALLQPEVTVYDVVDHYQGHPRPPADLPRTEEYLIRAADLLLTTSPLLQDLHVKRHHRVHRIHHGVAENFFFPRGEPPKRHQRLCYFGTLRDGIDYDALNALAEAGYSVALIGPEKDPPPPLHPAIELTGMVSAHQLIEELKRFDALLLPYTDSKFNQGITPAKIYECFATGRPVIASDMPGLAAMKHLLYVARRAPDFVAAAKSLDRKESPESIRRRVEEAARHAENRQFASILRHIDSARRSEAKTSPKMEPILPLPKVIQSILKGLTWITLFFSAAKIMTLLTHMIAARLLGPEQYGTASLILAVSSAVVILPLLGFPLSLSHFVQKEEQEHKRRQIVSTLLNACAVWSAFSLALLYAATPWIRLERDVWLLALGLAFLTACHHAASSALQGLTWFKRRGVAEILYGFGAPAILLLLTATHDVDHTRFILCLGGGLLISSLYSAYQLSGYLRPKISARHLRAILPYTLIGTLNLAAAALVQAPGRISLYHFQTSQAAGVYSAYFMSTAQLALAILTMAWTVLVPLTSQPQAQREAWRYLAGWIGWVAAAGFVVFTCTNVLALIIIGRSYPIEPLWIILFAAAAAMILAHGLFSALFAARDTRGLVISAVGALSAGVVNLALNILLVPRWGITGAALSLLAGYGLGIVIFLTQRPAISVENSR